MAHTGLLHDIDRFIMQQMAPPTVSVSTQTWGRNTRKNSTGMAFQFQKMSSLLLCSTTKLVPTDVDGAYKWSCLVRDAGKIDITGWWRRIDKGTIFKCF